VRELLPGCRLLEIKALVNRIPEYLQTIKYKRIKLTANRKPVLRFGMNTASKLGPHTQTDRGTCPGVGL